MVKVRQDAWSHEDDLLLAETVLRHIREGSTQLNAFEEVGDQLNRTAAACGFRWNAEVRKNYEKAVDLAKRQRKKRKQAFRQAKSVTFPNQTIANNEEPADRNTDTEPSIDSIINQLVQLKHSTLNQKLEDAESAQHQIEVLEQENKRLKEQYEQLKKEHETLKQDYQTFVSIMERARKMIVFDEDSSLSSPAFKMEKNGNLEKIAK